MSVCQSASMSAAHKMLTNCKKGTWSLDKRESFSIFISLFQFVKRRLTRKHVFGFCWSWLLRWWKDYWRCRPDIIVSAVFRCGLTLGPQFGSVVPRGWLFAWGNWQIPHRWLRWRWLNEFFPHQKQLLKMSPKVRDSWYRIVLFPTVETTLRTVAAITLWIWHGWGCSCMSSTFFFVVSDGWIGLYPSLCFLLAAQPLPPSSRYAGCLTPKALPPPFRVGFVAALLSIERQHPKVIHRVSSRATWRSANARTGIRLLGLRLGFMLSYSASQRGFMIHAIHAGSSWLVATVDPSTAKPCHWSIPSSKCWRMNLAPLPFLPHTHRKETRFPSNPAGYISVFLGIGVAHDIGDVDTGFILKFSECIRKVCKATKESFFFFSNHQV